MTKNSIFKNTFFAFLLQFTNMLYPLITAPYVSQVIGVEGLGKVNFSTSVVGWFTILATFGTTTYGVRSVAMLREDRIELSKFFSEMIVIKVIATIITIILYIPSIIFVEKFSQEYLLFLIQGSILVLNIFSLDWFFQGVEDYKYITTRSILLKVISLVALYIFVKSKQDYIVYAGISIFALSFSNVLNYVYSKKYIYLAWNGINIKRHIRTLAVFFASSIVISVYALLDQVLLGFMKGDNEVALYARAKLLLSSGMVVSSTISNVIMPRLNNYFTSNKELYMELLTASADIILMISIPIMAGMSVLANMVMILFGGQEFLTAGTALLIVSPLAVIVPIGTWNYLQRMLPHGHERIGLYGQIAMAIISITSNIVLIPRIGFIGAAISYLIAETTGTIIGFIYMHEKDSFRILAFRQIKYIIAATGMVACVLLLQSRFSISWLTLFFCIIAGSITYFSLLLGMRERMVLLVLKNLFNILSKR